jgi:endogenous inhibitor of DNA gyrase (YacG/DUF329 family)
MSESKHGTVTCPICGGARYVLERAMLAPYGRPRYHAVKCPTCKGKGRVARREAGKK